MPVPNYDYVLHAANQLESAARKVRSIYVLNLSDSEKKRYISEAEANINAALLRIQGFKVEAGF